MKRLYSILAATLLCGPAIHAARAAVSVSVDFFHDNLGSYGDWREVGDYGYCWQPRDVDRDWRPYNDGRWLYTDAGWTWDSEEPYSWAVYHYGRWVRVDRIGWVWVPGTEWGPAWVSWRRSAHHVGWAPLPPEARFSHSIGFGARVDADFDIGPTNYNFVEVRNFGAPRLRTVIIEPRENITIIHQTTNITRITYVNNVVYNEGPQYDVISRESAQPIQRLKLERREAFDGDPRTVRREDFRTKVEGDSLRVMAPKFDATPATAPRKVAAKVEKAEVDRGWNNAGPLADVEKLRTKIKSEPATPAEQPPHPKAEKTAVAPAVSPDPSPMPDEKQAKGKANKGAKPKSAMAPVTTEAAPVSPEQPVALDRQAKPVKAEASSLQPPTPSAERTESEIPPKKGKAKEREKVRHPAELPPQESAPARVPKSERVAPARKMPPTATEPVRQKIQSPKREVRPKPEQPAARTVERSAPKKPEPLPQAKKQAPRKQAAPAVKQPQAPQPAKGKGKGKDEKKDEAKPEGTLQ